MRSKSITFLLVCLMTMVGLMLLSTTDRPVQAQEGNLLQNPGFEAGVYTFDPDDYQWLALYPSQREDCKTNQGQYLQCNTANVPLSWMPWWISQAPTDPDWKNRMPEYKPARPPFVNRIHSGNEAAQYFSFFGTHTAGLLQVVTVPANSTLRFSLWGQAWSTIDDSTISNQPTTVNMRIGIDPLGGTNPYSPAIVWSEYQQPYDVYSLFTVEAQAQGDKVTVFTISSPAEQRKHNDIYWDDAELVVIGGGAPPTAPPPPPPAVDTGGNAGGDTGQTGGTGGGPVAQVPPANQPSPTPNAEGLILVQVQPGDSFWSIAARNGLTLEEIYELNGASEGTVIKVGDMLIVGRAEPPAPEEPEEPEEAEEEVTAAGEELAGEEDAAEGEEADEEAEATPEPTAEPTAVSGGTICLSAFDDPNQNGLHDAGEALKGSVAFTISTSESVVTNYVTDGFSEPYCIRGLEPGNYRITRSVADSENLTTQGDWAVSVSNGTESAFEFGSYVEEAPAEVADVAEATDAGTAGLALADSSGAAERTVGQAEEGPGLGRILVIAAVVVVVLLILGVGVLVLSSRRATV